MWRCWAPHRAVSGSDSLRAFAQNPANWREFHRRRAPRARSLRNRRLHGGESWIRTLSRRIGGEPEPPNLATETNTGRGVFPARNPQSPVRIRERSTAKTPRNRGDFSGCAAVRAESLCSSRLRGGARGIRTFSTRLSVLSAASARPWGRRHLVSADESSTPGSSLASPRRWVAARCARCRLGSRPRAGRSVPRCGLERLASGTPRSRVANLFHRSGNSFPLTLHDFPRHAANRGRNRTAHLATEKNAGRSVFEARNPPSPVRMRHDVPGLM